MWVSIRRCGGGKERAEARASGKEVHAKLVEEAERRRERKAEKIERAVSIMGGGAAMEEAAVKGLCIRPDRKSTAENNCRERVGRDGVEDGKVEEERIEEADAGGNADRLPGVCTTGVLGVGELDNGCKVKEEEEGEEAPDFELIKVDVDLKESGRVEVKVNDNMAEWPVKEQEELPELNLGVNTAVIHIPIESKGDEEEGREGVQRVEAIEMRRSDPGTEMDWTPSHTAVTIAQAEKGVSHNLAQPSLAPPSLPAYPPPPRMGGLHPNAPWVGERGWGHPGPGSEWMYYYGERVMGPFSLAVLEDRMRKG